MLKLRNRFEEAFGKRILFMDSYSSDGTKYYAITFADGEEIDVNANTGAIRKI